MAADGNGALAVWVGPIEVGSDGDSEELCYGADYNFNGDAPHRLGNATRSPNTQWKQTIYYIIGVFLERIFGTALVL